MSDRATNDIVANILRSKKYRGLCSDTVRRIVAHCLVKYPPHRVEHHARNMLHQMWGAYWTSRPDFSKLTRSVVADMQAKRPVHDIVSDVLRLHSSTHERLPLLPDFYTTIFSVTGVPASIIDIACGLNPLTALFMNLPETTSYSAFDIDREEIAFLNELFPLIGLPNVHAYVKDVFDMPYPSADVVFLLKLLPCIEHQKKNGSLNLLQSLRCRYAVVSYPVHSIGGIDKGMAGFYEDQFIRLILPTGLRYTKLLFDTELVFIIDKKNRPAD